MMAAEDECWDFAQHFYATSGVSEACLALQDEFGADVCVMLHLLYLASGRRSLSDSGVVQLDAAARQWRETVIVPLRHVRQVLRQPRMGYPERDTLRRQVVETEIEAERMQIRYLACLQLSAQRASTHRAAARGNLSGYADLLRHPDDVMLKLLTLFDRFCTAQPHFLRA